MGNISAWGIFAQLCSPPSPHARIINSVPYYISKFSESGISLRLIPGPGLCSRLWGHFRKSNDTFPRKSNVCWGRKSHYPTQVGSYSAYPPSETLRRFHCSIYTTFLAQGRWRGLGKGFVNLPGPLLPEFMVTWRESWEQLPLKGTVSFFAAETQGGFYQVKRKAAD